MIFEEKNRMKKLAGINDYRFQQKNQTEKAAEDYFGMNDEVQFDDKIEGFKSLINRSREINSDENIESIESINKRASMLYPGKKYKSLYSGEHMMELSINKLKDNDEIDLSAII
tara:strand:+ start:145 stop:486 length:342 start_codon:yes stop_codon:yes gene_type:complete